MMKSILLTAFVVIGTQAMAANTIKCVGENKAKLILTRELSTQPEYTVFSIQLDEKLSSEYLGEMGKDPENKEYGAQHDENARFDQVISGDGNYWITVSLSKGFLSAAVGAESKAKLVVQYSDMEEDRVTHTLKCTVTE